ncbi:hypothetical protein [Noviherbaspirillum sp.]|uniref:hypothetical protein n=1 Tax=Noviherbaspirillum sp. TaxID=1926288 RepID=UPI002B49F78B|nr:hypothetical protein [Noviherbaspirillum sp.]HJV83365.1 hypothetical protein [Noviherbaspirillum sp.]
MAHTLIRVFDSFSKAENARNQLLDAGFSADCVQLVSQDDEAGAMRSNFSVGNAPSTRGGISGLFSASPTAPNDSFDQTYARDYAKPEKYCNYLLTVEATDEEQQARAADIVRRLGASEIQDRRPGR